MRTRGRFAIKPHQGKERAYVQALRDAGYKEATYHKTPVGFALYDLDSGAGGYGHRPWVVDLHERGVPLFMYPHSARPMVQYDGIIEPFVHARCMFTIGEGHKRVMEAFGYPLKIETCGWALCGMKPFQPVNQIQRVLFGPIHPNNNGWLSEIDQKANRETYIRLHQFCKQIGAKLVIRHIQDLQKNGFHRIDGDVEIVRGLPNGSTQEIDQADLVVAHQTFAYIAIARGKPVLMMGEDETPHSGNADDNFRFVKHWDAYKDLLMYPLDILATSDTQSLAEKACQGGYIDAWKDLFIGTPFNGKKFVRTLEGYL